MIEGARLKAGVTPDAIATPADERRSSADVIRGRALIFWDLKVLGKKKKLDAIDTDQITPAADCVSESLETLDERWKAGALALGRAILMSRIGSFGRQSWKRFLAYSLASFHRLRKLFLILFTRMIASW